MGYASLVCTYLYGSFAILKAAIETYIHVAKNVLKLLDTLVSTINSTINYVINSTLRLIINMVKQFEKELFDMLYSYLFGEDKSFWCNKLWKCVALLNELLDSNSWLNQKIKRAMERSCRSTAAFDMMDLMKQSLTDFTTFQQTVCKYGFTVEFGISYIKKLLDWIKTIIEEYTSFIDRNWRKLKRMAEGYLNQVIDWGIVDYLDKLLSFFTCAFDDSYSCSEIATASNLYNDALSKLKLQKNGIGYDLSTEYKNAIYGGLTGCKNQCSNVKDMIDGMYALCIDPKKVENANNAYNLSKNVFPGGMSLSDIRHGRWEKNHICSRFNMTKQSFIDAYKQKGLYGADKATFRELLDGTFVDSEGHIYVRDGCNLIMLDDAMPADSRKTPEYKDFMMIGPGNNSCMMDPDGNIMSVTEAAIKIAEDPDSKLAEESRTIYEFINDWKHNPDGAIRYNEEKI